MQSSTPGAHDTSIREHRAKNMLEAVTNLIYLANLEATDSSKVREYMTMAEDCMKKAVADLFL